METALLVALGLVVGLAIAGLAIFVGRQRAPVADNGAAQLADQRVVELGARVQAMGELLAKAQTHFRARCNERLDAVTQRLGKSMQTTTKHTAENLQKLNERLAVIDHAQKNITELASQVTSLQSVLTNKQSRGAFGQGRMEAIVQDGLPKGAYEFQFTLSNRKRPGLLRLPARPAAAGDRREIPARRRHRVSRGQDRRRAQAGGAAAAPGRQQARRRHRRRNT